MNIVGWVTSYGNSALFGWVLHLTMTTNRDNNVPSVFLEHLQNITNFHSCLREVWQYFQFRAFLPLGSYKKPGAR